MFKLVAFDGDETLWMLTTGLNLSDRTADDAVGWPNFTYEPVEQSDSVRLVRRTDGELFTLRPEVPFVLKTLKGLGVVTGVITYNHEGNARRILDAFGITHLVDYVVGEWHSKKDDMMRRMLAMARADGHNIEPGEAMLIDDDPFNIYKGQYDRMGAGFRRFGYDIEDLSEILPLVQANHE